MLNVLNKILMIVFILAVIGAFVFFFISRQQNIDFLSDFETDTVDQQPLNLKEVISEAPVDVETDDVVEIFKSVFTEEEQSQPEFQQFMDVIESKEYIEFLETQPVTLGEFFDFFASQGIPVSKDAMMSVFLDSAPIGSPEQLEQRAYVQLSTRFQEIPYNIRSPQGQKAFEEVVQTFLDNTENVSWMMTHFQGDFIAFGEWTVNVFRNPISDIPEDIESIPIKVPREITEPVDTDTETLAVDKPEVKPEAKENLTQQLSEENQVSETRTILSKEDIQEMFKEHFSSGNFTDEEIYQSMQFLIIFGEKEGIDRLKIENPIMAEQLEHIIENRQRIRRPNR